MSRNEADEAVSVYSSQVPLGKLIKSN